MTRVRYIADSMAEAVAAARRQHGIRARIVHAGALPGGFGRRGSFEVVVDAAPASLGVTRARRAARLALARAVIAARRASDEAGDAVAAVQSVPVVEVRPAVLARLAARLRLQSLPEELVSHVLSRVEEELGDAVGSDDADALVRHAALQAVAGLLPVSTPRAPTIGRADGRPHVVLVAGPTGVGKTTTVAKLAAAFRAEHGLRVGLVAADAFRVGAVEQLRTYAQIIGAPVRPADGPSAVRDALASLASCDVVLVDTPGRGHRDSARIDEVRALVEAARPDETHLVLPGSASAASLDAAVGAFGRVGATRIVLSKLDESETLGGAVAAVRRAGAAASWFTTGQEVPDDIERADAHRFAEILLGEDEVA